MRFIIINGPNLNLIGVREPEIYGTVSFDEFIQQLKTEYNDHHIDYYQSNIEGEIINKIHETGFAYDGIVVNLGGYSHTSVAIADAIKSIKTPVVEVHISNIHSRESYRQNFITASACVGCIAGLGIKGYKLAIDFFL